MPDTKPILVIQGGQYGSEAKGAVTGWLALNRRVDWAVRTGAVNAGHTVYYRPSWASGSYRAFVNQQLPVAWVNPTTALVLGPGTMIEPETLWREIARINKAIGGGSNVIDRLYIDYRCGLHQPEHAERSAAADRHHLIGATGKGCSEAIIDKIRRRGDPDYKLARDHDLIANTPLQHRLFDTSAILNQAYDTGRQVLLEGTQGAGLDLHLGPYPYTTHKPCNAAQWVVEAGLSPALDYEVVLVMRTMPIRVAGNSGPMRHETDWVTVAEVMNFALRNRHLPPRVDPQTLAEFARLRNNLAEATGLPHRGAFHLYTADERVQWRDAISELDKQTLERMEPAQVEELCKLFEMTTVTRKLRRIGDWDAQLAAAAVQWNRPAWIAMTFCNYMMPTLWGWDGEDDCPDPDAFGQLQEWLVEVETQLKTPIRLCGFGPHPEHFSQRVTAEEMEWG
jgi:adenylosuccinate synthase